MTHYMVRFVKEIIFVSIVLLFGSGLFAQQQHHLFFDIPECPNPINVETLVHSNLAIYPIPASNYIIVSFSETISNDAQFDLSIYSITGVKVFSKTYKSDAKLVNNIKINVKTFKAGVYYLQYKDKNITRTEKILITN